MPGRAVAAALGPADDRERTARPARAARRASRRRRSRRRPRPSAAASRPPARSKPARAEPVLPGELVRVAGCASAAARGCRRRTARRTTRTPGRRAMPPAPGRAGCTRRPASASSAVATRPARPAPTTMTSASIAALYRIGRGRLGAMENQMTAEGLEALRAEIAELEGPARRGDRRGDQDRARVRRPQGERRVPRGQERPGAAGDQDPAAAPAAGRRRASSRPRRAT